MPASQNVNPRGRSRWGLLQGGPTTNRLAPRHPAAQHSVGRTDALSLPHPMSNSGQNSTPSPWNCQPKSVRCNAVPSSPSRQRAAISPGRSAQRDSDASEPLNQPPRQTRWSQPSGRLDHAFSVCHTPWPASSKNALTHVVVGTSAPCGNRRAAASGVICTHSVQSSEAQTIGLATSPPSTGLVT